MGVGAALLPRSKVGRGHGNCRPLVRDGRPVEISYEAVWARGTPLAADVEEFVDALVDAAGAVTGGGEDREDDGPSNPAG